MGRHAVTTTHPTAQHERWGSADRRPLAHTAERHVRTPWSLPLFASVVSLAFVLAAITDHSPVMALEVSAPAPDQPSQVLVAADESTGRVELAEWKTSRVVTYGTAPAAGTPDPGTAQAIALQLVTAQGWSTEQFDCLVALWNKESRWNVYAHNASSGAYGIPQALPGSKMASAGEDWATNPATQITWGLGYVAARYGDPCGAWAHSQRVGWY